MLLRTHFPGTYIYIYILESGAATSNYPKENRRGEKEAKKAVNQAVQMLYSK